MKQLKKRKNHEQTEVLGNPYMNEIEIKLKSHLLLKLNDKLVSIFVTDKFGHLAIGMQWISGRWEKVTH